MHVHSDDGWRITERGYDRARLGALVSVLAVGNGYLGVRGAPAHDPGVVLNGFHETWPIVYPEDAYGLARTGQTIVAPPDRSVLAGRALAALGEDDRAATA